MLFEAEFVVAVVALFSSEGRDVLFTVAITVGDAGTLEEISFSDAMVVFEIDGEKIVETAVEVELEKELVVCIWALAKGPEMNDERRARSAMVTRTEMMILSPKPVTFVPKYWEVPSTATFMYSSNYGL